MGQQGSHSDPSAKAAYESLHQQNNDLGSVTNHKPKIFKSLTSRGKSKSGGNSKISKKHQISGKVKLDEANVSVENAPSSSNNSDNDKHILATASNLKTKKEVREEFQSNLDQISDLKLDKGLDDGDELFCDARDSHSPNDETPYMSAPENGSSMELSFYDNPSSALSTSTLTPVEDVNKNHGIISVSSKYDKILKSKSEMNGAGTIFPPRSSHSAINSELSQSFVFNDPKSICYGESENSNIFTSKFGYSLESGMETADVCDLYKMQSNNKNMIDGSSSVTLSSDDKKQCSVDEMDAHRMKHFQPYKRHTSLNEDSDYSTTPMRINGRKSHVRCSVNSLTSASLEEAVHYPKTVPEKLDFKQLDKFEGQMLISWLCSSFSENSQIDSLKEMNYCDYKFLSIQFCTYLLAAGVIRQMEFNEDKHVEIFKPDLMYYWAHTLALQTSDTLPGKLNVQLWPFVSQQTAGDERISSDKSSTVSISKKATNEHLSKGDLSQIAEYEQKLKELKQEVEKYRILSGIESLNCIMPLSSESSNNKDLKDNSTQTKIDKTNSDTQTSDYFTKANRMSLCERATSPIEDLKAFIFTTLGFSSHASKNSDSSLQKSYPPTLSSAQSEGLSDLALLQNEQNISSNLLQDSSATSSHSISTPLCELVKSQEEASFLNQTPLFEHMPPPPPALLGPIQTSSPFSPGSLPPPPPCLPTTLGSMPPPPPPPPPSSFPPGSIPPPPPLSNNIDPSQVPPAFGIPSPTFQVSRKTAVLPNTAMKPLFWKKIQVQETEVHESDSGSVSQCLWNFLQEPDVDFSEFEEFFAKAPARKRNVNTKIEKCKKTKEVVKLLDSKKSQALGIFITSLHVNVSDIETALLEFDSSSLSMEMLATFYEQRPEESEIELVRNFLSKHPDSTLDRPEQFIYDLSQIPCFDDRCYCFIFQSSFFESLSSIEQRLINVKMVVENIMNNPDIETLFGLILALGNYMNGGTIRGQADGFGLDILSKLKDVKSKDNSLSLLEYIVRKYLDHHVDDETSIEHVSLPIPEPSDVTQAANVNFDDLSFELDKLSSSLRDCQLKIDRIISKSSNEVLEPFQSKMGIFMNNAKIAITEQESNLTEVKKKYESCVYFFMVNSQKGDEALMSLKDFFGLWLTFCQDFKDVWKREMQKLAKVKQQEAQQKLKMIKEEKKNVCTRMPVKKSGLKAKLASKGII